MMPEQSYFEELRNSLCAQLENTAPGVMMRSPAVIYGDKVFCFLNRQHKMVFKLGDINPEDIGEEVAAFSPFKTKGPLRGWWEVPFSQKELWQPLALRAYRLMKS